MVQIHCFAGGVTVVGMVTQIFSDGQRILVDVAGIEPAASSLRTMYKIQ